MRSHAAGRRLFEVQDQRRAVVEDRSLVPNVIDETLRFEPTGHAVARSVTDKVDYYGTTMPQRRSSRVAVGRNVLADAGCPL